MRRLLAIVSTTVLVDTMFFAAITPLLPYYVHHLHIGKASAGVLVGAYPAGALLGALPSGWLAAAVGHRRTVLIGVLMTTLSSVAFGFLTDAHALEAARFVQGVGSAASWTGALSWLVGAAAPGRRAEMMGTALGAALGGALLGPVLGGAAGALGPRSVFGGVALVGFALVAVILRTPSPAAQRRVTRPVRRALAEPRVRQGAWLVAMVGMFFGVIDVLVPLRMGRHGAGATLIAGTFLLAAALEGAGGRALGRAVDRRGPRRLARGGLLGSLTLALVLPQLGTLPLLVACGVAAGPVAGLLWIPGMTLLAEGAEVAALDPSTSFAIMNLAWAAATTLGSGGGAALAQATSDALPFAVVGTLCAATLLAAARDFGYPKIIK